MRPPRFFAACDDCWEHNPEAGCHYPESIAWSHMKQMWLCDECWEEYDTEERTVPLVYAKDAMLDRDEQTQRLIAAATKQRLGVK